MRNPERYPANWRTEIVPAIRARAGDRCEGSPAYPDCRVENHTPHPVSGKRVVLTTAHLDHNPSNCDPANLRYWCQKCHNTYDAPMRAARAAETRRKRKAAEVNP
jgi:hypothetical protein